MNETVRDLLKYDMDYHPDLDVVDDVTGGEELCVGFYGPCELTEEGEKEFALALDLPIDVDVENAVAIVYCKGGDWEKKVENVSKLFYSFAGQCSEENWNRWFQE